MQELGNLGGIYPSNATAVSADGLVVVGNSGSADGPQAVRWTAAEGIAALVNIAGYTTSLAGGISADGDTIVGQTSGTTLTHTFRWTGATGMVGLGFLAVSPSSQANDASADGSVIVGTASNTSGGAAFIWTPVLGMRDIRTVLINSGVSLTGWLLNSATSVSDDGTVIAGFGIDPAGQSEAWVAVLPATVPCYANCDQSTAPPVLNVNDFVAFRTASRPAIPTRTATTRPLTQCST